MKRNVITIERGGRTIENFGAGLLDAFPKIEPLIGHMTKEVENFSIKFKDALGSKSGKNELAHVINELQHVLGQLDCDHLALRVSRCSTSGTPCAACGPQGRKCDREGRKAGFESWTGSSQEGHLRTTSTDGLKPLGAFAKLDGCHRQGLRNPCRCRLTTTSLANVFRWHPHSGSLPVLMDIADVLGDCCTGMSESF
jgi:hypothetical protein